MKPTLMSSAIVCSMALGCGAAEAGSSAPTMTFLSVPAVASPGAVQAEVVQFRHGDAMVVVYRQPAACGERPSQPWFDAQQSALQIGYSLPNDVAAAADGGCFAAGIFAFKGLPDRALQVVAQTTRQPGEPVPEPVAAAAPTMSLLAAAAVPVSAAMQPGLVESASGRGRVVVARVPARCGERPLSASFQIKDRALRVAYEVAEPAAEDKRACVATAIFTFKDLPRQDLEVAAVAQPSCAGMGPSQLEVAAPAPVMSFMSVPAVAQDDPSQPERLEYRSGDRLVVILKEPSVCGERPSAPWVDASGPSVRVGYDVPSADSDASGPTCMATGIFTLTRLPDASAVVSR
jgi:hypothetical protein